jgi:hypothetical protein
MPISQRCCTAQEFYPFACLEVDTLGWRKSHRHGACLCHQSTLKMRLKSQLNGPTCVGPLFFSRSGVPSCPAKCLCPVHRT